MLTGVFGVPVSALVAGLVVWKAKLAGTGAVGAIEQIEALPGPELMIVANAVAGVPPTSTERLSGNTAARSVASGVVFWTKFGVTVVFAVIVTVQGSTPAQPPPDQPAKVELLAATAVNVTWVPTAKLAEQVAPQLIPDGPLVTVPEPLPVGAIDSMKPLSANFASTVALAVSASAHGPLPLHPPPLQPVKFEPVLALAVKVIGNAVPVI